MFYGGLLLEPHMLAAVYSTSSVENSYSVFAQHYGSVTIYCDEIFKKLPVI